MRLKKQHASTHTIPDHIIEVLKSARCEGNKLFLEGQLDRKTYADTMKVIELLGGKWSRKDKAHIFEDDCADRIDTAIMAGEVVDLKKMFQFFETPKGLATDMVSRLTWEQGMKVLEPSAGKGRLIEAILGYTDIISIDFCEMNKEHRDHTATVWRDYAVPQCADFMELPMGARYDRIVMNPPFRNGQDIAHVRRAFDLLKPGGQMVAITYPAWQYRDSKKFAEFRDWLKNVIYEVEDIPAGAFAESGTNVRSLMLVIRK